MADLPSDFWSGWIALITVISLLGLIWLVFSIYFGKDQHHDDVSPVWDDTLSEGSNPAPMWWFWMILILMVFSVSYLMLYPGLGSYRGALKWSQGGSLGKSYALHDYEFGAVRAGLLNRSLGDLQADPQVMRSAQGLFARNCSACHGQQAKGQANMFPDLTDASWQWGSDPASIESSIRHGRQAMMPAWLAVLGEEGVSEVSEFVAMHSWGSAAALEHPGQVRFEQFCSACHGPEGRGNPALGAPDLADEISLYGHRPQQLQNSIANGRAGVMPAFDSRLDDVQIRLLVAWLTRNSNSEP